MARQSGPFSLDDPVGVTLAELKTEQTPKREEGSCCGYEDERDGRRASECHSKWKDVSSKGSRRAHHAHHIVNIVHEFTDNGLSRVPEQGP